MKRYELIKPSGNYKYFDIIDANSTEGAYPNFCVVSIFTGTPDAEMLAIRITALLNKEGVL